MKQSNKPLFSLLLCLFCAFALMTVTRPLSSSAALMPGLTENISDQSIPMSDRFLPQRGAENQPAADAEDGVRPEAQDQQVAGASDEAPSGFALFWGIVLTLLIAGAVIFGIFMMVPKEDE